MFKSELIAQQQNTQTLQLFEKKIKTEIIYISDQNAMLDGLGSETKWSKYNEEGSTSALIGKWKNYFD